MNASLHSQEFNRRSVDRDIGSYRKPNDKKIYVLRSDLNEVTEFRDFQSRGVQTAAFGITNKVPEELRQWLRWSQHLLDMGRGQTV